MSNRRSRGGGSSNGSHASERAATVPPPKVSSNVVDLNSRSATHIASIVFLPVQQHTLSIIQFKVRDCLRVCQQFRHWLQTAGSPEIREMVRIDDIELNLIAPNTKGNLFFLEGAATLEGEASAPVSIFALQIPRDKQVRYLWTPLSPSLLLSDLTTRNLIGPPMIYADQWRSNSSPSGVAIPPYHHTLYTIIAQCFEAATKYPDSPAMIQATKISDVCPSILDPATAHQRIDATDDLHSSHDPNANGKDLGDDRYIHDLHPAERELASLLYVGCADYLPIKRTYFKKFSREVVLHAAKVRRATAHSRNSNRAAGLTGTGQSGNIGNQRDGADEDDNKKGSGNPITAIPSPVIPNLRATPSITRSRTRTQLAANQQNVNQTALDDKQDNDPPAAPHSRAASGIPGFRTRSQRASVQQTLNRAMSIAGTEQMDVTMKDDEDDGDEKGIEPAAAPNSRATPLTVHSRTRSQRAAIQQNAAQAVQLASTEQNDVKMKDQEDDDDKPSEDPPVGTANPRVTRSSVRTRQSTVDSVAMQNVSRATPLAGIQRANLAIQQTEDDGAKENKDSPAGNQHPRAAAPVAPRPRSSRSRRSGTAPPARVATPIATEDAEDAEKEDESQNHDSPASADSSANLRATPTTTATAPATRPRGRRVRLSAAELAASRSNAAFAGARNRAMLVRTVNKHIRTLEEQAGLTYRRAYKFILGWEVLGFIDEERVLAVQEGEDNDGDGEWSE